MSTELAMIHISGKVTDNSIWKKKEMKRRKKKQAHTDILLPAVFSQSNHFRHLRCSFSGKNMQ